MLKDNFHIIASYKLVKNCYFKGHYQVTDNCRALSPKKFNKVASRNPNEGYANIEKDDESRVEGILYTIRELDIEKLDRYEGYPDHYTKLKVRIKLDNGKEEEAIVYVANPKRVREGLRPSRDYLHHLLKGCDLLSEEYRDKLREWETLD
ncbi:gamma-glutamylcyclotransferase family protein [Atrimonas thermophila]|uniref:gamma-glutamylcyclotransferase family protein n=1 Tax=Atrimonas thermophila TaxID=3064161 RepID=UPI00399D2DAB